MKRAATREEIVGAAKRLIARLQSREGLWGWAKVESDALLCARVALAVGESDIVGFLCAAEGLESPEPIPISVALHEEDFKEACAETHQALIVRPIVEIGVEDDK